jgi:hypothetical protein
LLKTDNPFPSLCSFGNHVVNGIISFLSVLWKTSSTHRAIYTFRSCAEMSRVAKAYKTERPRRSSSNSKFTKEKRGVPSQRTSDKRTSDCCSKSCSATEGESCSENENQSSSQKFLGTVGEGTSGPVVAHKLWNVGLGDSRVSLIRTLRTTMVKS